MSDLGLTGLTKPDSGSDLSERVCTGQPRSESREPLRPLRLRTPKHTRQWREFALLWDAKTRAERMRADAMFSMARVKVATRFVHWARQWKRSRIQIFAVLWRAHDFGKTRVQFGLCRSLNNWIRDSSSPIHESKVVQPSNDFSVFGGCGCSGTVKRTRFCTASQRERRNHHVRLSGMPRAHSQYLLTRYVRELSCRPRCLGSMFPVRGRAGDAGL